MNASRILLVEDEPAIVEGLEAILRARGHAVEVARRGDDGLQRARSERFDLILLDVMLPGKSGFDVLRELRAAGVSTAVILLTARQAEMDKVLGFELGVDDYVTKPFSPMELLGRVGAVLRRTRPPEVSAAGPDQLSFGPVELDLRRYVATRGGEPVELPSKAFDVLRVLARAPGEVLGRDQLIDAVWGQDAFINLRTLNNLAVRIRQVIEPDPQAPRHLVTVHGVGYRLDV